MHHQYYRRNERAFRALVVLAFLSLLAACFDDRSNTSLVANLFGPGSPTDLPGSDPCDGVTSLNLDVESGLDGAGEVTFGKTVSLSIRLFASGSPLLSGTCPPSGLSVTTSDRAVCQVVGSPTFEATDVLAIGRGSCTVNALFNGIASNPRTFIVVGGPL